MTDTHTPGPWLVDPKDPTRVLAPDGDDTPWHVCTVDRILDQQHIANARLIAAAPDMATEITRLRAERGEMMAVLAEAGDQISYLHDKARTTGSGCAVLSRVNDILERAKGGEG